MASDRWSGELRDPKTDHRLVLHSDEPFDLRQIDLGDATPPEHWPPSEKRPDGVLIVDRGGTSYVCFVELKGLVDLDEQNYPAQAYAQCTAGARHFAPLDASHGAEHHAQWAARTDLPDAPPNARHEVLGVVLVQRSGSRAASRTASIAGKTLDLRVMQRSGPRKRVEMTVDEFLGELGLIAPPPPAPRPPPAPPRSPPRGRTRRGSAR